VQSVLVHDANLKVSQIMQKLQNF